MANNATFNSTFSSCKKLTTIIGNASWNTEKVTSFYRAFQDCWMLLSLDVTNWDVGEVTTFHEAFSNCYVMTSVGSTANWDTAKVNDMYWIFHNNYLLNGVDVSGWDVHLVTDMTAMFANNWAQTTLDVSNWVTTALTNCFENFYHCRSVTTLDVSGWDMSHVTTVANMFIGCYALTSLDLSLWNVSLVQSFLSFVESTNVLTSVGDISSWNTGAATTFSRMFRSSPYLSGLVIHDLDVADITTMSLMFEGSNSAISNAEYDLILAGWSAQSVQNSVAVHFGDAKYSSGDPATARAHLVTGHSWSITDGGQL
jgi:surface protein